MELLVKLKEWFSAGTAMGISSAILNPMDVVKIRMQTSGQFNKGEPYLYKGFRQTLLKIYFEEGIFGLWIPGLAVTCMRELSYGGLTFALYPIFKKLYGIKDKENTNIFSKLVSGFGSGLCASGLSTPTDLVKIRLQQNSGKVVNGVFVTGLFKTEKPMYKNTCDAFFQIYRSYGIHGLYKGTSPTMLRAALLISGKFASYDQTKTLLRNKGYNESFQLHLMGGLISGFVASVLCAPADIVKTRLICDPKKKMYIGIFDCLIKICRYEGPFVLFRGFWSSFGRQGPHFVISTPLMEKIRHLLGLSYF